MNRDIKFRGWNTKKGITREYTLNEILVEKLENNGLDRLWLQYTGLKDRNGVEIYEGDIIESIENNMIYSISNITPLSRMASDRSTPIGLRDGKDILRSNGISENYNDDWISNPDFYEVIGNIYQNPDLLTNTE